MIAFRHNMEVAHRLLWLPGKCQRIHGHSMKVTLKLFVEFNGKGYAIDEDNEVLDFGNVKKIFRGYIDDQYDHRLLLNEEDPWAQGVPYMNDGFSNQDEELPGLVKLKGDPSTENLAGWIAQWARDCFKVPCEVEIAETETNIVGVGA